MIWWWIGRKLTIIPAVGLGFGAGGAFIGTYDVAYKTLTSFIKVDESTRTARAVKYTCAGMSGGLFVAIRELYVPRYDLGPKPSNWKESFARAGRLLANFPWRYRLISVFGSGVVGAVGSIVGLRLYQRSVSVAPTPSLSSGSSAATEQAEEAGEARGEADTFAVADDVNEESPVKVEDEFRPDAPEKPWNEFEKAEGDFQEQNE